MTPEYWLFFGFGVLNGATAIYVFFAINIYIERRKEKKNV